MAQQQNLTNEQQRQVVVERMWLHYYNNTLREFFFHAPADKAFDIHNT